MKSKSDSRHSARKLALAGIFSWLFSDTETKEALDQTCSIVDAENADMQVAQVILDGVKKNNTKIDKIVAECAPDWPLDKISRVDLVILRIAIFELLFRKTAPEKVVIDEAVELSKEFGNDTSSKFVNGVLGTVLEKKAEYDRLLSEN